MIAELVVREYAAQKVLAFVIVVGLLSVAWLVWLWWTQWECARCGKVKRDCTGHWDEPV